MIELMKNLFDSGKAVNIKLLGDSITHGSGGTGYKQEGEVIVGDFRRNPNGYCWAKLFKEYMESKYNCKVTNNGCSGTTIEYTIEHFNELVYDEDDVIICTIGTNNRHKFFYEVDSRPTKEEMIESFYANVLALNKKLVEADKKVIFVANIPASVENETKDGENYWRIIQMSDINNVYKRAQKECGFELISLYDLFLEYCKEESLNYETLLCDGLHPNDNGYKIMYEILVKALEV